MYEAKRPNVLANEFGKETTVSLLFLAFLWELSFDENTRQSRRWKPFNEI